MKRFLAVFAVLGVLACAAFALAADAPKAPAAKKAASASAGKAGTWKGEVLDAGCYMAHGAMGPDHKECALKCAANGMPLMLMVSGKPVLLTMDHDNADPFNSLKTMAGSVVEVTGKMYARGGSSAIEVASVKAAE